MLTRNHRTADHDIDPLFLDRWSPRAFDGSALSDAEIMTLFEAARWAPSSFNAQPWHFIYARRDTPAWAPLFDLLIPFNQGWVSRASLLAFAVSSRMKPGKDPAPSYSHSFDTGAAWASLAFQATRMGLQAHGMAGFDVERSYAALDVPKDSHRVEAAIAVGRPGDKSVLPEGLRERETPSGRKPVTDFVTEGRFTAG